MTRTTLSGEPKGVSSAARQRAVSGTPARSLSISVWPGQPYPAAARADLQIGAVTMASTAPSTARETARSIARAEKRPASSALPSALQRPIEINGKAVKRGPDCRIGRRERIDGADLIVWLKLDTEKPVKMRLISKP